MVCFEERVWLRVALGAGLDARALGGYLAGGVGRRGGRVALPSLHAVLVQLLDDARVLVVEVVRREALVRGLEQRLVAPLVELHRVDQPEHADDEGRGGEGCAQLRLLRSVGEAHDVGDPLAHLGGAFGAKRLRQLHQHALVRVDALREDPPEHQHGALQDLGPLVLQNEARVGDVRIAGGDTLSAELEELLVHPLEEMVDRLQAAVLDAGGVDDLVDGVGVGVGGFPREDALDK